MNRSKTSPHEGQKMKINVFLSSNIQIYTHHYAFDFLHRAPFNKTLIYMLNKKSNKCTRTVNNLVLKTKAALANSVHLTI